MLRSTVTGRFAFVAPSYHNQIVVGKAPSMCGLASRCWPKQLTATHGGRFAFKLMTPEWDAQFNQACQLAEHLNDSDIDQLSDDVLHQYLKTMEKFSRYSGRLELVAMSIRMELQERRIVKARYKPYRHARAQIARHYDKIFIAIGRRDTFVCANCGSLRDLEIDHKIPVSAGGSNDMDNLQLLCKDCNLKKSNH